MELPANEANSFTKLACILLIQESGMDKESFERLPSPATPSSASGFSRLILGLLTAELAGNSKTAEKSMSLPA